MKRCNNCAIKDGIEIGCHHGTAQRSTASVLSPARYVKDHGISFN